MKHNDDGRKAEDAVADYLIRHGYTIRDRNWKNRQCEIDIVAEKADCVYFVEVKYRSNPDHGTGLEYITPTKLRQMQFAARYWVAVNNWDGAYTLSAASVGGAAFDIDFIPTIF